MVAKADASLPQLNMCLVVLSSIDWLVHFHAPPYNHYRLTDFVYKIIHDIQIKELSQS